MDSTCLTKYAQQELGPANNMTSVRKRAREYVQAKGCMHAPTSACQGRAAVGAPPPPLGHTATHTARLAVALRSPFPSGCAIVGPPLPPPGVATHGMPTACP